MKYLLCMAILSLTVAKLVAQVQEPSTSVYTNSKHNDILEPGWSILSIGALAGKDHWGIEWRAGQAIASELALFATYRFQNFDSYKFSSLGTQVRYYIGNLNIRPVVAVGYNWIFAIRPSENTNVNDNFLSVSGEVEGGVGVSYFPKNATIGADLVFTYFKPLSSAVIDLDHSVFSLSAFYMFHY